MAYDISKRPKNLNEFATHVHERNKRWWVDLNTGEPIDRNVYEMLMLMICEIAEAAEGHRKELQDNKLHHRSSIEVELADCLIRLFDLVGGMKIFMDDPERNYVEIIPQVQKFPVGEHLYNICSHLASPKHLEKVVYYSFGSIEMLAIMLDLDIWGALLEKLDYNDVREDFKDEARRAAGGKKW